LIQHGADPNLGGGQFDKPIIAATQKAELQMLKLLLAAPRIDVNVVGGSNRSTPLINAATYMSLEAISALLEKNADINAQNDEGDTALIMAALNGEKECVELLVTEGADVTHRSPRRGLAIQVAA
ncbi:ankyrin, partial [Myriangium duriaei CBS 260.36]